MKKNWLIAALISCMAIPVSGQTLFSYGNNKATTSEFLQAFNKNNQEQSSAKRAAAMRDYLNLYINSRLKIQQALDRGYDTLPQIRTEVEGLRNQIIENYLNDPQASDRLTKEAFQRSLKDVHVAHIFISGSSPDDTAAPRRKLNEVLKRLQKGEDFFSVARNFSDDPAAKTNKGDLGYITVFILPYEFENIVYKTAPGKYAAPYRSKSGYHIFKNLGERKAFGKIRIQQILLGFPPGITEAGKQKLAIQADSLYKRIMAGDDFGKLATQFSNDMISAGAEGNVPDISVGEFEPDFEKIIWGLPSDGFVSKPFLSAHGYHIVKRIKRVPLVTSPSDKTTIEDLKQRVARDDRWKTAKDFIYTKIRSTPGIQPANYSEDALWALSDSLLDYKPAGIGRSMSSSSPIFKIGTTTYDVSDWINFATVNRYKTDRDGTKPYPVLLDDFMKSSMEQYYRNHLEEYNPEFRNQMHEFRDGNLFFEIMQQEVWSKAQADSVALMNLYEKNKNKYFWGQSADAVIFFCSDEATARKLSEQVRKQPGSWKVLVDSLHDKVATDSGRYEWQQLPGTGNSAPVANSVTQLSLNSSDNTASFAYVSRIYMQPAPRSFNDAKGLVINDYQTILEEQWLKDLKSKYPVIIDEKVLSQIAR